MCPSQGATEVRCKCCGLSFWWPNYSTASPRCSMCGGFELELKQITGWEWVDWPKLPVAGTYVG